MYVLKIGGSLFDLDDLGERIVRLVARRGSVQPVLIAGGGSLVDRVREFAAANQLSDGKAHELAMSTLSQTASQLAERHPSFVIPQRSDELPAMWRDGRIPILPPDLIPDWQMLPASWDVTSDSLALWAAAKYRAERLVLCKSVDRPPGVTDWSDLSERGLVDRYFPQLAAQPAENEALRLAISGLQRDSARDKPLPESTGFRLPPTPSLKREGEKNCAGHRLIHHVVAIEWVNLRTADWAG